MVYDIVSSHLHPFCPLSFDDVQQQLRQLSKADFEQLRAEQQDIVWQLLLVMNLAPDSDDVQVQIARHFANIQAFGAIGRQWKQDRSL